MTFSTGAIILLSVGIVSYWIGRRTASSRAVTPPAAVENVRRAQRVAHEMEQIVGNVRRDLARHRVSVARFQERIHQVRRLGGEDVVEQLCQETESVLQPTRRLGMQISMAYDEIRQQSRQLQRTAEVRRDRPAGVLHRRALQEILRDLCRMLDQAERPFAIAVLSIDRFHTVDEHEDRSYGDQLLRSLATLLLDGVRGTDVVAQGGGEEFIVVLPHTPLAGACGFAHRLRADVAAELPVTVSCGVAEARPGDSPQTLLARADSALYSAKAGGRNCIYQHDGFRVAPVDRTAAESGSVLPQAGPSGSRYGPHISPATGPVGAR